MAFNTLSYADASDLKDVFADYTKYLHRVQLTEGWTLSSSGVYDKYKYYGAGDPGNVYRNGVSLTKVVAITTSGQFKYTSASDEIEISVASGEVPSDDSIIEIGKSSTDAIQSVLVKASEELNAKIDNKYPRPLPKTRVTHSTDLEYESIVKRLTCLLGAKNMIKAKDPLSQDALVYEQEAKEIIEGLNNGSIKLVWEDDATEVGYVNADSNNTGLVILEEVVGNWSGRGYDEIVLIVTTGGGLGEGEVTAHLGNSDELGSEGGSTFVFKPTGSFDYLGAGLMVRFSQTSTTDTLVQNDKWYIPVKNTEISGGNINSNVRSLKAVRNR